MKSKSVENTACITKALRFKKKLTQKGQTCNKLLMYGCTEREVIRKHNN